MCLARNASALDRGYTDFRELSSLLRKPLHAAFRASRTPSLQCYGLEVYRCLDAVLDYLPVL